MSLILSQNQSSIYRLAKGMELLAKAKQRKIGYENWNKSALWFSTYEQEHRILIIDMAIARIRIRCYDECLTIQQNL